MYQRLHKSFRRIRPGQFHAQMTDPVPDSLIKQFAVIIRLRIILDNRNKLCPEKLIQFMQIKGEQLPKNPQIMQRQRIHAAVHRAHDFAGFAECIFIINQQKSQISVP